MSEDTQTAYKFTWTEAVQYCAVIEADSQEEAETLFWSGEFDSEVVDSEMDFDSVEVKENNNE